MSLPFRRLHTRAGQRQVVERRLPSVLFGDRMIHLMRGGRETLVAQLVFTAVTRPLDHETSQRRCGAGGHEASF
jgi:hypothetical protein